MRAPSDPLEESAQSNQAQTSQNGGTPGNVLLIGWGSDLSSGQVGHWAAAIQVTDPNTGETIWQIILSTFPGNGMPIGSNVPVTDPTQLVDSDHEGRSPDGMFLVPVANMEAFTAMSNQQAGVSTWTFFGGFGTTQCTYSVSEALIAGQAPVMASDGTTPFRWPDSLMNRMNSYSSIGTGGVVNVTGSGSQMIPGLFN